MKYFLAIALIVAVATAQAIIKPKHLRLLNKYQLSEVQDILDAINSPSTDPLTAAMLKQMLDELLGINPIKPPIHIPGIIEEGQTPPIHIPGIIEEEQTPPIHIPGIVEEGQTPPIHIPGIIEEGQTPPIHIPGIIEEGQTPPIHIPGIIDDYEPIDNNPVIVDFPVHGGAVGPSPINPSSPLVQIIVNVYQQGNEIAVPEPEIPPTPVEIVEEAEIENTPVIIVDGEDQVLVVDEPAVDPEPVIVTPIDVAPAVLEPEVLN